MPVNMGTGVYVPQTKLIEFFIAVLAELDRLRQLNEGERPRAEDVSLAVAWLREGWRTTRASAARCRRWMLKLFRRP